MRSQEAQSCSFQLLQLKEDVIFEILLLCDVEDILICEKTCSYLRSIISTRHFWITFLSTLDYDFAPNFPHHIEQDSLSALAIRQEVVRCTRAYNNWTSRSGARVTHETIFRFSTALRVSMVLPGCEHFVVHTDYGDFSCWSVAESKRLARYSANIPDIMVMSFDCRVNKGGDTGTLAYHSFTNRDCIEVIDLDFRTGIGHMVLTADFPALAHDLPGEYNSSSRTKICDNGLILAWIPGLIMIIDKDQGGFSVLQEIDDLQGVDIVYDHLICILRSQSGTITTTVTPIFEIFKFNIESKPISHRELCAQSIDLPVEETSALVIVRDVSICDPFWQSRRDCRILILLMLMGGSTPDSDRDCHLETHHLRFSRRITQFGDNYELTYVSASNRLRCERFYEEFGNCSTISRSGRAIITRKTRRDGLRLQKRFGLQLPSMWRENYNVVCVEEKHGQENDHNELRSHAAMHMEKYSGSIWYQEQGNLIIQHFH